MRRRTRYILGLAATALAAISLPASAGASATAIIRDCYIDGKLDGNYSVGELQDALRKMPADADQYSDCPSIIRRAASQTSGSKRRGGKSRAGAGGTAVTTATAPHERNALAKALRGGGDPVRVGGELVEPGEAGALPIGSGVPIFGRSFVHALPTPVWALVAALALASVVLATPAVGRLVAPARRLVAPVRRVGALPRWLGGLARLLRRR